MLNGYLVGGNYSNRDASDVQVMSHLCTSTVEAELLSA